MTPEPSTARRIRAMWKRIRKRPMSRVRYSCRTLEAGRAAGRDRGMGSGYHGPLLPTPRAHLPSSPALSCTMSAMSIGLRLLAGAAAAVDRTLVAAAGLRRGRAEALGHQERLAALRQIRDDY